MEPHPSDLLFAIAFAFGFPVIVYVTGMAWGKITGSTPKVKKVWTSFCLLFPIFGLIIFVQVGAHTLRRLWATSPYSLALVAVIFGLILPALLITAVVRLWRPRPNRQ
jgi:hypothetical protein